jgi:hypothetical protein
MKSIVTFACLVAWVLTSQAADSGRKSLSARASELDPRAQSHPEIDFVFEKDGKPQDIQNASVNTSVKMQGKLVIWLMGHSDALFERLNGYGLHAIQVHYANKWFGKLKPTDRMARGNVRLEAAIGRDVSDQIHIPQPDSMMERSYQFVKWLAKEHPAGKWKQFLTADGKSLLWEKVIISGSSHGSTTAARFAKEVKVSTRPGPGLAEYSLSNPCQPLLRFFTCPGWRLVRGSLLQILGTSRNASVWSDREC